MEKDSDAGRDWGQEEKGTTKDEMYGKIDMEIYINIYKIANGNLLYGSGNKQGLCINLEGWDGEGDGR